MKFGRNFKKGYRKLDTYGLPFFITEPEDFSTLMRILIRNLTEIIISDF